MSVSPLLFLIESRERGQESLEKTQEKTAKDLRADLAAFPDLSRIILLLENIYLWLMRQLVHGWWLRGPISLQGRAACRWSHLFSAMSRPSRRKPNGTEHGLIFRESQAATLWFDIQSEFPFGAPWWAVQNSRWRGSFVKPSLLRQGAASGCVRLPLWSAC